MGYTTAKEENNSNTWVGNLTERGAAKERERNTGG